MQAHSMAASQQHMHPAGAVPAYGLPPQGYAVGQDYFPATAYPMALDDDPSMAIMSAVAPDAIFWDSMMMPGWVSTRLVLAWLLTYPQSWHRLDGISSITAAGHARGRGGRWDQWPCHWSMVTATLKYRVVQVSACLSVWS